MKAIPVERIRDLTLIRRPGSRVLVIGCDSSGGIGNKPLDAVQVPSEVVGYFTSRVAVMEVLSVGADILTVADTLSVEMNPTGREIIRGIQRLLKEAELHAEYLNGSTEENFKTVQTGIGVTVIGEADEEKLKLRRSVSGDLIVMLGEPLTGLAVLENAVSICSVKQLKQLTRSSLVHEVIPVGSKGALYEAGLLADLNGCDFLPLTDDRALLEASGGPSTSVIFSIAEQDMEALARETGGRLKVIGYLAAHPPAQ